MDFSESVSVFAVGCGASAVDAPAGDGPAGAIVLRSSAEPGSCRGAQPYLVDNLEEPVSGTAPIHVDGDRSLSISDSISSSCSRCS